MKKIYRNQEQLKRQIQVVTAKSGAAGGHLDVYLNQKLVWTKSCSSWAQLEILKAHIEALIRKEEL